MNSVREGLLESENAYVMVELAKGVDDIAAYFQGQGNNVKAELVDSIEGIIGVYRIKVEDGQDAGADN